MDEPYWLEDYLAAGHKANKDGTVDLYHGTTKETAVKMVQAQKMLTAPGAPAAYGVYLSTDPAISEKGGYGDGSVVRVRCRVNDLELDDQFPDGRMDFSVQQKTYRPVRIFHHGTSEGFKSWLAINE
jgi:hypothetical protein